MEITRVGVWIPMQNNKSVHVAVVICAIRVNTQTALIWPD